MRLSTRPFHSPLVSLASFVGNSGPTKPPFDSAVIELKQGIEVESFDRLGMRMDIA
jgi:hypothetical protein